MTIRREKDLFEEGNPFFVEVAFPSGTFFPQDVFFPQDIFLAVRDAYQVVGVIALLNEKDWAANPESVDQVSENRFRLRFFPSDIFFPSDVFEEKTVTMALGVFPERSEADIPSTEIRFWDTDTVRVPPKSESESLNVDVRRGTVNPEEDQDIPVEVTFPSDVFAGDVSFPSDVYLGVGNAFETIEEEGGQEFVTITDEYEDGVATPKEVSDFGNPHEWPKRYLMTFASEDLRYPEPDGWDGTLGLGVFPDGVGDVVPEYHLDTDTVRVTPGSGSA